MDTKTAGQHGSSVPGAAAPPDQALAVGQVYLRPGFLIRRAHQINTSMFSKMTGGATNNQFGVMWVLSCEGEVDQTTLTRCLCLDKTTIGLVVRILEKKGWIRRAASTVDRRQTRVSLTEEGHAAFRELLASGEAVQRSLLANLSLDEQRTLTELLTKLVGDLPSSEPIGK